MLEDIEKDAGFSVEKVDEMQTNEPTPYDMGGPNVQEVIILTDEDLISFEPVQWSGMGFKCKRCGAFAALHFMKRCDNCGVMISVRSPKTEEYIKSFQQKYNRS